MHYKEHLFDMFFEQSNDLFIANSQRVTVDLEICKDACQSRLDLYESFVFIFPEECLGQLSK